MNTEQNACGLYWVTEGSVPEQHSFPASNLLSRCASLLFEIDGPVSPLSSVAQLLFPSSIAFIGMSNCREYGDVGTKHQLGLSIQFSNRRELRSRQGLHWYWREGQSIRCNCTLRDGGGHTILLMLGLAGVLKKYCKIWRVLFSEIWRYVERWKWINGPEDP